ncbi:hypothetical protein [uncultured Microbulbifer sp.]|uniref:hypothetical protein n=1 Tax=uncultured Microbulbifer sp. TaxID=348147 RepID=UPI00262C95F6|nr:hypothetical protein [uncultured Microbulbifer sp.]
MQSSVDKTVGDNRLLFPLGAVVMTQRISSLVDDGLSVWSLIARHAKGDWGQLDEEDREQNELALQEGGRLFSQYNVCLKGVNHRIWVITEADRKTTAVLLPVEY